MALGSSMRREIGYPNAAPSDSEMTGTFSLSLNPFEARVFTT
jgi:hypothetical protein